MPQPRRLFVKLVPTFQVFIELEAVAQRSQRCGQRVALFRTDGRTNIFEGKGLVSTRERRDHSRQDGARHLGVVRFAGPGTGHHQAIDENGWLT